MVPAAGQLAQGAWEVEAAGLEVGEARAQHPGQVALAETLMIQATGHVSIVRMQISGQLPFVQYASNVDKFNFSTLVSHLDWKYQFCHFGESPITLRRHVLEHCGGGKE